MLILLSGLFRGSNNRVNQLGWQEKGQASRRCDQLPSEMPLESELLPAGAAHSQGGSSRINPGDQVKLPAQGILIFDELTLKPTTIPAIRWCTVIANMGVPGR